MCIRWTVVRILLLLLVLLSSTAVAQQKAPWVRERFETAAFSQVQSRVKALAKDHSSQDVLLVLDIDNTLLAMNQHLGSDQWFDWQSGLLETTPQSKDLVASDFEGLLRAQGILFALSGMHAPEPQLPTMVKDIQKLGVTCVVLTSRGPGFRNAAQRELARNGYDFSKNTLQIVEQRGLFKPIDTLKPNTYGLSVSEVVEIAPRLSDVTYSNGIYMVAGQHKGYMLRVLLARAVRSGGGQQVRRFKALVFVDDHQRHTERMHDAFATAKMDVITFRYSREDGNVSSFANSSKRDVTRAWRRLQRCIDDALVQ